MSSKEKQMNEGVTVPLTLRALIQRINRKLRQDDQRLRTARGWFSDLGHPEARGRDLGLLKDYELLLGSWSYPNT